MMAGHRPALQVTEKEEKVMANGNISLVEVEKSLTGRYTQIARSGLHC